MMIILALLGAALLAFGRKLFWLLVAVIGFVVSFYLSSQFFGDQPGWLILVIGLVAGGLGAVLALFLQQLALGLAGFLGGGYLTLQLMAFVGWGSGGFSWLPFILGGILGAILVAAVFEWALIVLSSLIGSILIIQAFAPRQDSANPVFFVLLIVGIVIQAIQMRSSRKV